MPYAGVWLLLFAFNAIVTVVFAPSPFSLLTLMCPGLTYTIPVGILVYQRRWRGAGGMVLNALVAPIVGSGALWLILQAAGLQHQLQGSPWLLATMRSVNSGLFAAVGFPLGLSVLHGWTYSRAVFVVTGILCVAGGAYMALSWEAYGGFVDSQIAAFEVAVQDRLKELDVPAYGDQLESLVQLRENKAAIAAGIEFAAYLTLACALVSVMAYVLRKWFADPGPIGSFRNIHPPDWLVWVAIVTALMWIAEKQYGWTNLRFVSWNVAIGLAALYFLNGCAIFLYGIHTLAPNAFLVALLVFLIGISGNLPVLGVVGFFDTWANFRMRMDRLAEAIRNAQSGES